MGIRLASSEDEAEVRACAVAAYSRYVGSIGKKPAPMVADFGAQIAAGDVYVAAADDGSLDGFIVFRGRDGDMFLENVAVRPDRAGRGIGGVLIEFCEAFARVRGFDRIILYTNEKMVENLAFYPHLGFTETDRRLEDGFHRVYFEKRLK